MLLELNYILIFNLYQESLLILLLMLIFKNTKHLFYFEEKGSSKKQEDKEILEENKTVSGVSAGMDPNPDGMDPKTKKILIVLGVLIAVGVAVVIFWYFGSFGAQDAQIGATPDNPPDFPGPVNPGNIPQMPIPVPGPVNLPEFPEPCRRVVQDIPGVINQLEPALQLLLDIAIPLVENPVQGPQLFPVIIDAPHMAIPLLVNRLVDWTPELPRFFSWRFAVNNGDRTLLVEYEPNEQPFLFDFGALNQAIRQDIRVVEVRVGRFRFFFDRFILDAHQFYNDDGLFDFEKLVQEANRSSENWPEKFFDVEVKEDGDIRFFSK